MCDSKLADFSRLDVQGQRFSGATRFWTPRLGLNSTRKHGVMVSEADFGSVARGSKPVREWRFDTGHRIGVIYNRPDNPVDYRGRFSDLKTRVLLRGELTNCSIFVFCVNFVPIYTPDRLAYHRGPDGVVGYHARLTRARSRVRSSVRTIFFSLVFFVCFRF